MSQDPDRRGHPHHASSKHHQAQSNKPRRNEAQDEDRSGIDSSTSITPQELAHLGSPFAHTPAPADLIDLWDETERFFDALGDPHEFIEPEGTPTFDVHEPILSEEEEVSDYLETDTSDQFVDPFLQRDRETSSSSETSKEVLSPDRIASAGASTSPSHVDTQSLSDAKTGRSVKEVQARPQAKQQERQQKERQQKEHRDRRPLSSKSAHPPQVSLAERFDQRHQQTAQLIVIAGGRGGAGRSLITANLALCLAKQDRESVVVADLDPLGTNLHTHLGLEPILTSPGQQFRSSISPVIEQAPNSEVVLVRSARPICEPLSAEDRARLLSDAVDLQPRWLIVDAGILPDPFTLELFVNAHHSLVVYTPDPSAVERGHSFLRAALYHHLIGGSDDTSVIARSLLSADYEDLLSSPDTLARALRHVHAEASREIEDRIRRFRPKVVINQCRTRSDEVSGEEICSVLRRKWRIKPSVLGAVSYHHVVHQSLIDRRPLTLAYPSAPPSLDLERVARTLIRARVAQIESSSLPYQNLKAQEAHYG